MTAGVLVVLLVLDLVTKQWAWDNLRTGDVRTVVDGWVYYEFGFNTGSAFSLLRDASWSRMLFIGITFLALLYMGNLARTLPTRFVSAFVAIGMVASGALGNLHDRFLRTMMIDGAERYGVVDFIKVFYWKGKPWPTFNVADVALVAGVLLLLWFLLRHGDVLDAQAEQAKAAKAAARGA
jgi:signal peptidase II